MADLELKRNGKHANDHVSQSQVCNKHVGDSLHSSEDNQIDDKEVARYSNKGGEEVENNEEHSEGRREHKEISAHGSV